jgi:hypothetical protein
MALGTPRSKCQDKHGLIPDMPSIHTCSPEIEDQLSDVAAQAITSIQIKKWPKEKSWAICYLLKNFSGHGINEISSVQ